MLEWDRWSYPGFGAATSTLVRCRLVTLLSWCFCPKLIFASFLHALTEVAKVFLLLFSKEEFKQLEGVCWNNHLSPLCPVGLAICPIAMALRGQAWGFPWFLGREGGCFGVVVSPDAASVEGRVSEGSPWLKRSPTTTGIVLLPPNRSSWPQIEGDCPSFPFPSPYFGCSKCSSCAAAVEKPWSSLIGAVVLHSPTSERSGCVQQETEAPLLSQGATAATVAGQR